MTQQLSFVAECPKLSWAVIGVFFVAGFFSPRWTGFLLPTYPVSLMILLGAGLGSALAAGGRFSHSRLVLRGGLTSLLSGVVGLGTCSVLVQVFGC
jgi:hypothetical protein